MGRDPFGVRIGVPAAKKRESARTFKNGRTSSPTLAVCANSSTPLFAAFRPTAAALSNVLTSARTCLASGCSCYVVATQRFGTNVLTGRRFDCDVVVTVSVPESLFDLADVWDYNTSSAIATILSLYTSTRVFRAFCLVQLRTS